MSMQYAHHYPESLRASVEILDKCYNSATIRSDKNQAWERIGFWCASRTSNPVLPATSGHGGFDSHTLPPVHFAALRVLKYTKRREVSKYEIDND